MVKMRQWYRDGFAMQVERSARPCARLLIDHENVAADRVSLESIFGSWFPSLGANFFNDGVVDVHTRAYGGWYIGENASEARYAAAEYYQNNYPAIIRIGKHNLLTTFEFADMLAETQECNLHRPVRITHSVALRKNVGKVYGTPHPPQCGMPDCELPKVRRWLRRGKACTHSECALELGDMFRRMEQKQVDIHLALDLNWYAETLRPGDALAVASDDADIIPAVLVAAMHRPADTAISLLCFDRTSTYLDIPLQEVGVQVIRCHE